MRIRVPEISEKNNLHVLSARIEMHTKSIHFPPSMWFAISGTDPHFVPGLSDAFLASLVVAAMKLGEDIRVEGSVSSRLAHGISHYQRILNTWWPESFKVIDIEFETLVERREDHRPEGVGCTFSGGLDSFHAVSELLPSNMPLPAYRITHALMINGFDQLADFQHKGISRQMYKIYSSVLAKWGVELLMMQTNQKYFRGAAMPRVDSVHSYSSALAACGHSLGGIFGRFNIAGHGGYAYFNLTPYGSNPVSDHHLSSDHLQVIYAGSSTTRTGKLELMADSPEVQNNLRICLHPPSFDRHAGGVTNCGECDKCVRTVVGLMILGKLDLFSTFPVLRPAEEYRRPEILSAMYPTVLEDLRVLAERYDKNDWVQILDQAIKLNLANKHKSQH